MDQFEMSWLMILSFTAGAFLVFGLIWILISAPNLRVDVVPGLTSRWPPIDDDEFVRDAARA